MKNIFVALIFLLTTNISNAEYKYNFVNHDKVNNLEYKLFSYEGKNIFVPVINGILPEITIKENQEITFDYAKKIKYDNLKTTYEIEQIKSNPMKDKNNEKKQIKSDPIKDKNNEKIESINKQIANIENNLKTINSKIETIEKDLNIKNSDALEKLKNIENKITEIQEQLKSLQTKNNLEKTINIIEDMKKENEISNLKNQNKAEYKEKEKPKEKPKENKQEEKLGLKRPTQIIK